ncbi:hypothetical protein Bbelb_315190 [Branchiostoma belcheri]|nr:hypothetical protein Bbelb_315190 [Branchiostoma belcheri]
MVGGPKESPTRRCRNIDTSQQFKRQLISPGAISFIVIVLYLAALPWTVSPGHTQRTMHLRWRGFPTDRAGLKTKIKLLHLFGLISTARSSRNTLRRRCTVRCMCGRDFTGRPDRMKTLSQWKEIDGNGS